MPRPHLGTFLVLVNAGLLLVAVAGVSLAAARLLRQLADDEALARVEQASVTALVALDRAGDSVATSARLLAQRPTLLRLIAGGDAAGTSDFLTQFQLTSQLDSIAVLKQEQPFASSGVPLPASVESGVAEEYGYVLTPGREAAIESLTLVAAAPLPAPANATVIVALQLDGQFVEALSAEVGLGIAVGPAVAGTGNRAALRAQVLQGGHRLATYLSAADQYLAIAPLNAPDGQVAGLVEAEWPASAVAASVQRLVRDMLLLALAVAAVVALANLVIGRRLSRPLADLTAAAARIGYGDLATPVAAVPGPEIGTLAATLDDMRRRLLTLTADLRRQQAESTAILTGIVEGVFTVDRERRIRYLNPQAAALVGWPGQTALARFCGDVLNPVGPDGRRPCEEQCPILHARFRAGARATEHLRLPDGTRRTVVITSAPPADDHSPSAGLLQVQVVRDETEVEATRRLRDAVLANISHEFKTPLAAQLASLELLLDQLPDLTTDQIGELLVSLERGALRLSQLVDNLLESARIEAGEHDIRRRAVALDEIVEQAAEMVRPLLDQRDQTLEVELPYPCPPICGDAPRLVQVFVNLLANANKFAPSGSRIAIGASVAPATVTAWVADQGPGLPALPGQALFARFVRASPEENETSGLGLGLWIVKSIVERHGGRIEANSGPTGTRMLVTLPRLEPDEDTDRG